MRARGPRGQKYQPFPHGVWQPPEVPAEFALARILASLVPGFGYQMKSCMDPKLMGTRGDPMGLRPRMLTEAEESRDAAERALRVLSRRDAVEKALEAIDRESPLAQQWARVQFGAEDMHVLLPTNDGQDPRDGMVQALVLHRPDLGGGVHAAVQTWDGGWGTDDLREGVVTSPVIDREGRRLKFETVAEAKSGLGMLLLKVQEAMTHAGHHATGVETPEGAVMFPPVADEGPRERIQDKCSEYYRAQ